MLKRCTKCGEEKDIDSCFPKKQPHTSPYIGMCYVCIKAEKSVNDSIQRKARYSANPEKYRKEAKNYKDSHPEYRERARVAANEYYLNHKEEASIYFKQRYASKKDEIQAYKKRYREENRDALKQKKHEYYLSVKNNPDYIQRKREYRIQNKSNNNAYFREKYSNDIEHKIAVSIRNRMNKVIKRGDKSTHTLDLLGCSSKDFIEYIRSHYTEGMSDEFLMNGMIHLDHIRPCASFVLSDEVQQHICAHYRNVRPLWALDNIAKNNRWDEMDQKSWYTDTWPHIKEDLLARGIIDSSYEGC